MHIKKIKVVLGFAALLSMGATQAAPTTTAGQTFDVTASVANQCAFKPGGNLSIGALTIIDATTAGQATTDDSANGSIAVICTNGTSNVSMKFATAGNLTSGSDTIAYTLHLGSGGTGTTLPFGADNTLSTLGLAGDGSAETLNISANVSATAKHGAKKGTYTDTITVTMTYDP